MKRFIHKVSDNITERFRDECEEVTVPLGRVVTTLKRFVVSDLCVEPFVARSIPSFGNTGCKSANGNRRSREWNG